MKIVARIIIDILLVVIAIMGWWWLVLIAGIVAAFYFPDFYELIGIGFIIDIVFGIPHAHWMHIAYLFTIIMSIIIVIIQIIKSKVRRSPW